MPGVHQWKLGFLKRIKLEKSIVGLFFLEKIMYNII